MEPQTPCYQENTAGTVVHSDEQGGCCSVHAVMPAGVVPAFTEICSLSHLLRLKTHLLLISFWLLPLQPFSLVMQDLIVLASSNNILLREQDFSS